MFAGEAVHVLDEAPNLVVRQLPIKSNHAGADRSVFDYPEDFAFSTDDARIQDAENYGARDPAGPPTVHARPHLSHDS